jgi:ACS family glucarate transporter-like MFS transporter
LKLDSVALGYLLSAFSVSYVTMQIPGGWLLDRFGSRLVYLWSIISWSMFTALQGFVGLLGGTRFAARTLYGLRLLLGAAEAPSFPANSRIVAWFPAWSGTAAAIFNSAQYFSIVIFYP